MEKVLKILNVSALIIIVLSLKRPDKSPTPCNSFINLKFFLKGKEVKAFHNINWFNTPIERTYYNSYNGNKATGYWADSISVNNN